MYLHKRCPAQALAGGLDDCPSRPARIVVATGRTNCRLSVEFREHEILDLWCEGSPAEIAPLRHGMWVVFRGKVVGFVQDRLLLEECEFREFFWYWEL